MFGLAYLAAVLTYLVVMGVVVRLGWRMGRRRSVQRALFGALAGFLVVFLPLFWNWIPTAIHYRRLCATDAGFVAYSSPSAWAANHTAAKGADRARPAHGSAATEAGFNRSIDLGGLRAWQSSERRYRLWAVNFRRIEQSIVDPQNDKVLARAIDYEKGTREDLRFWLTSSSCFEQEGVPVLKLIRFSRQMEEALK